MSRDLPLPCRIVYRRTCNWKRTELTFVLSRQFVLLADMWAVGCIYAELLTLRPIFKGEEAKIDNKKNLPFQKDQMPKIIEVLGSIDSSFPFLLLSLRPVSDTRPSLVCLTSSPYPFPFSSAEDKWPALSQYPEAPHLSRMERFVPPSRLGTRPLSLPSLADGSPFSVPPFPCSHYPTLPSWYKSKSPASSYSALGYQLLQSLFEFDPEKRITAREALACPWFTEESPKPSLKSVELYFLPHLVRSSRS